MDRLLDWLPRYSSEDPVLVAAWIHHRFAQVHPYQDGNGRVARALMTLLLLREELLPVVVDRSQRSDYIAALEFADAGDLAPLASLLARLERAAILQALSVDAEPAPPGALSAAVIESLAQKLGRRGATRQADLEEVNAVARMLRGRTRTVLEALIANLGRSVAPVGAPQTWFKDGGPDEGNAHWYKHEVIRSAQEAGKFANFGEDHYFVKAAIRVQEQRLVFVVSLHHVGRDRTGFMEATAFAAFESFEDPEGRAAVGRTLTATSRPMRVSVAR